MATDKASSAEDIMIDEQSAVLFSELDGGEDGDMHLARDAIHTSNQFRRHSAFNFTSTASSSVQSFYTQGGSKRRSSEPNAGEDIMKVKGAADRQRKTSSQSAWSTTSQATQASVTSQKSGVWRRDSLFKFGSLPRHWSTTTSSDGVNAFVDGKIGEGEICGAKERERVGFVEFTMRFLLDTAGHGLPRIVEKNISRIRRIAWGVIVLASACVFIVQSQTLINRFIDRDVQVDVTFNFKREIGFPAVTICNTHPINKSKLACSRFDTQRDDPANGCNVDRANLTAEQQRDLLQGTVTKLLQSFDELSADLAYRYNFTQEAINDTEYRVYGMELAPMLISCRFRGKSCNASDFTEFQNTKFGNCWTFNNNEFAQLQVSQPGNAFGLELEFYLDEIHELGVLSPSTGLRLSLHEPGFRAFPDEQGMSIPPAFATSVGVRKSVIDRLEAPYGDCNNTKVYNWAQLYTGVKYSRITCLKECLAQAMIMECNCVREEFLVGRRLCLPEHLDPQEAACARRIELAYKFNTLNCDNCTSACSETVFRTTLSTAAWPGTEYQREFKDKLKKLGFPVENVASTLFQEKYARVDVFYEELNYENIVQKPAYESENLLADLGGQLGFWLGLSVLAILEFVEYGVYVLLVMMHKVEFPVEEVSSVRDPAMTGTGKSTSTTGDGHEYKDNLKLNPLSISEEGEDSFPS